MLSITRMLYSHRGQHFIHAARKPKLQPLNNSFNFLNLIYISHFIHRDPECNGCIQAFHRSGVAFDFNALPV